MKEQEQHYSTKVANALQGKKDLDPITIAIVKVACAFPGNWFINPTVLGPRWCRLSVCVHVAFAFAEAIGVKSSVHEVGEADTV
ncbi:hypothetical protein Clacol_010524 [Clathrus columnatus]|uniref:Uncharacterized protein n=1 Tax=Clathrus columnatus TaxID=1419009 RepID=A0AAV5AUA8_9AGAM|nr:hypothetical protein Clacol_010524 [Clathrus columnatus]